ncbi:LysE type translocator [alpha proteobacterium HIMB59]|jgi:L-lysine exporter family protein LysE/ArgO|nr:LysE type translocator [alpha proteobacterium HIMB59]
MSEFLFGFTTGLSFILAIGAQNLFVIEQGIKKNHIFLITTICALSDFLLIFLGIFIFYSLQSMMTKTVTLFFNLALIVFLAHFIWGKIKSFHTPLEVNTSKEATSKSAVIAQTLGFTFLNPHVYSDTVFILGNLSKSFVSLDQKILFGLGATLASLLFFYFIGYTGYFLSRYFLNKKIWNITNSIIIIYLIGLVIFLIFSEIF